MKLKENENEKKKINSKEDKPKVKRSPGRPRKYAKQIERYLEGVRDEPYDKNNFLEFVYDRPLYLKKLLNFFKSISVEYILIKFNKDSISFLTKDHYDKNKILTTINCNKVKHYYCNNPFQISIICKDLELILNKIDKSYNNIIILSKNGSIKENLTIILKNIMEVDEEHIVELVNESNLNYFSEDLIKNNEYVISIDFNGKFFKKFINDIKSFADYFNICQDEPDDNIYFEYVDRIKNTKFTSRITNNKKFNIVSKLEKDNTFRTSIIIDYIRPISTSFINNNINICFHEYNPSLTTIGYDNNTILIQILTEIINNRSS
tara:strand:- start:63 stop:1022 length:960 start_codon:yes stop_codon:yes gene_type:complete